MVMMQINVLPVLGLAGCHVRRGIYEVASPDMIHKSTKELKP